MNTLNIRKRITTAIAVVASAILCGAARAEEPVGAEEEAPEGWNYAAGEGISFGDQSIVSAEFSLSFDSKYLSYGLVDNNEPILTPSATVTFFDWFYFYTEAIYDLTTYGRKAGYGFGDGRSRGGRYIEFDPGAGIAHAFSPEDYEWLPTTVEISLDYMYEYHPRSIATGSDDTQFLTLEIALPDLWLEPTFSYERDLVRDNGTYLNLELGHTFTLVGDEEDPVLTLRPSIAQGFGNRARMKGYLSNPDTGDDLSHAGLMDTMIKLEAGWTITPWLSLSGYVGYSDFLFDRTIRDASRYYEASEKWNESYNFVGGLALTACF